MPLDAVKIGERKAGLNDVVSLKRELDSLRGYRDVMHETLKGLVAKTQSQLTREDTAELVHALQQVADELVRFSSSDAASSKGGAPTEAGISSDEVDAARADAARQQQRADAAEADLARKSAEMEAEMQRLRDELAVTEQQREAQANKCTHARHGLLQAVRNATLLETEATALEDAMVQQAFLAERKRLDVGDAYAAEVARLQEDLQRAEADAVAAERARASAAAAAAAAAKAARDAGGQAAGALEDVEARRAQAEAALAAVQRELRGAQRELDGLATERDEWHSAVELGSAEIARLKRRVDELEAELRSARTRTQPHPPSLGDGPAPPPPKKTQFTAYVEERRRAPLTEHVTPAPAPPPPPAAAPPPVPSEAAQPPKSKFVAYVEETRSAKSARATAAANAQSAITGQSSGHLQHQGSGGSLRSARERGGPLLRGSAR